MVHEGPPLPRTFRFSVRAIADALVDVGSGMSYRDAARRVRRRSGWGIAGPGPVPLVSDEWQVVADWVEVFAPVVAAPFQPTRWPDVVLLDHLPFHIRDWDEERGKPRPSGQLAFCVFGALGYVGGAPMLWRLEAFPSSSAANWETFLDRLPGTRNEVVLSDNGTGSRPAPKSCSPTTARGWSARSRRRGHDRATPRRRSISCTWHLTHQLALILKRYRLDHPALPIQQALKTAFWDTTQWDAFADLAAQQHLVPLDRWLARLHTRVAAQVAADQQPQTVGALEQKLRVVKRALEERRRTFRNRERMNRLLLLVQMRASGLDDARVYARLIRQYLAARNGVADQRHAILDAGGVSSLRR
jgi:hypothetical protein